MDNIILAGIVWIAACFGVAALAKDRKIGGPMGFLIALFLSPVLGLVIVLISDKKHIVQHKYKSYVELAEREELKGHSKEAVNHYIDAIYSLEHDYPNLRGQSEENRINRIYEYKQKIEKLKVTEGSH